MSFRDSRWKGHELEPHAGPRDEAWAEFEIICAGMRESDEPNQRRHIRTVSLKTGYGCVRHTPTENLLALECMSFPLPPKHVTLGAEQHFGYYGH